jgi:hypothetical protein
MRASGAHLSWHESLFSNPSVMCMCVDVTAEEWRLKNTQIIHNSNTSNPEIQPNPNFTKKFKLKNYPE